MAARWMKVAGIVVAVLIVIFVIGFITGVGPGSQGPGQHGPPPGGH